jgi:hypothetical protein
MNAKPKIALLFLTKNKHSQEKIWDKFLKGNEDKYDVFTHVAEKGSKTSSFLNGTVVRNVRTEWGHLINAYHILLETAYKESKDAIRFVYLSDSCVPLMSGEKAYEQLIKFPSKTFYENPHLDEDAKRYFKKSNLDGKANNLRFEKVGILEKHFFKHSGWFALCKKDAKTLLENRSAFLAMNHIRGGDEHVLSILKRNSKNSLMKRQITYVDWNLKGQLKWAQDYEKLWKMFDNSKTNEEKIKIKLKIKKHVQDGRVFWHPKTFYKIDKKDIEKLKKSNCIFARKIDKNTDISLIMKNV